jgi:paraquat-inducible protein B
MKASESLPSAEVTPRPRLGLYWLLPLVTLGLVVALAWRALGQRSTEILVELDAGHGLRAGDPVRYRGIDVGQVRRIELGAGLDRVRLEVVLEPHATGLARVGTRFFVPRPKFGPAGVSGLETLLGPRSLALEPGPPSAPPATRFQGLEAPPSEVPWRGGLEVLVEARSRGGLSAGASVFYRQFPVGQVTSVALASDASSVELRLNIDPNYAELVRERTRFFETSGLAFDFDLLHGLSFQMDSLEALLAGGLALATPNEPGARVSNGHRFALDAGPPAGFENWRPDVPLGAALLPPGSLVPRPLRLTSRWREGGLFGGEESRRGWVLRVPGGLLGPADLLHAPRGAREGSAQLEVEGRAVTPLPAPSEGAELGELAEVPDAGSGAPWPKARRRELTAAEDLLLFGDPSGLPRALAAARLVPAEHGGWLLDPSLALDDDWHGAPVLARSDGALVGLLLCGESGARLAALGD